MSGLKIMAAPPMGNVFTRQSFTDSLEYVRMLSDRYGISAEAFQIAPGHCLTRFEAFTLSPGELELAHTRIELEQYIEFAVPQGFSLVSLSPNQESYVCNGARVQGAMLSIYPGGGVYSGTYPANRDAFDILISHSLIRENRLLQRFPREGRKGNTPLIAQDGGERGGAYLDRLARLFTQAEETDEQHTHYLLSLEATGLVMGGLSSILVNDFLPAGPSAVTETRRPDLVEKARAYIESHPEKDLTAEELAEGLGVTYRLLHYAFTDSLEISPFQYLQIKRLHDIRETLKSTDMSIRDACYAHGFYTLSRFRRQYVRLFGELPSETRSAAAEVRS